MPIFQHKQPSSPHAHLSGACHNTASHGGIRLRGQGSLPGARSCSVCQPSGSACSVQIRFGGGAIALLRLW